MLPLMSLHEKPYITFPDVLKRWSFQKNLRWNIIFFVLSGKVIFLFPENRILHLDEKWKMIFLKKNTWKYDIFVKCSEKMVYSIKLHRNMIFLVLSEKVVFFSQKHDFFLWTENERWSFSRKTWKYDFFCIYVQVLQTLNHAPLPKTKSKMNLSHKKTPKSDWDCRL